jgi:hypothetical protein
VSVEPDGSGWYQIEEILDHRGPATHNGECLVRWKDFDTSHDTWIRRHSVTPLALQAYEEFLTTHAEASRRLAARTHHKSDITRSQTDRKHLESFIGRAGAFSVLRRQSSNVDTSVQPSVRDTSPSASSPVATASETSDVAQNAPSAEFEVAPVVSSTGRVFRRPVRYKDTRRWTFLFFLVVRDMSHCFCFLSCFYSRTGTPGTPHISSSFSLSSFSWYSCRDAYDLEGGSGRSGPDLLLF